MEPQGYLQEAFVSFQGEALHVGRRQVFLRMAGCSLRCRFCDTPEALVRTETVIVHEPGGRTRRHANPVTAGAAAEWVQRFDPERNTWVSLTGGEPLEQANFLAHLVPFLNRPVYLETAGVHAAEVKKLANLVRTICFDLKLDSVAMEGDRRRDHAAFLKASRGPERIAKIVISERVDATELGLLAALVGEEDPSIPLVLQPETPRDGSSPILDPLQLEQCYDVCCRYLQDVRVIPQTHRWLRLR